YQPQTPTQAAPQSGPRSSRARGLHTRGGQNLRKHSTIAPMRWDAIIVGAGPAGATLAILLARSGWQTLLIDSGRFPRDKVCGECRSTAALPVLREIGLEQQVRDAAVRQQRLRITVPNRASLDFPLRNDGVEGVLGISRRFLDALLVQAASRSGV